jgi:hypothetical protein
MDHVSSVLATIRRSAIDTNPIVTIRTRVGVVGIHMMLSLVVRRVRRRGRVLLLIIGMALAALLGKPPISMLPLCVAIWPVVSLAALICLPRLW